MQDLAVYVKKGLPFAQDQSLENSVDLYKYFALALLHSVFYFFLFYQSPSSLYPIFYFISSNRQVELIDLTNSVIISNDLVLFQMTLLKWLTFLFGYLTVTLTVLLFWIYFFLLTLVFVLQRLSLHSKILTMLLPQFPVTFKQTQNGTGPFHHIAFHYSSDDWVKRDVPCSVLLLLLVNFMCGSCCNLWIDPSLKVSGQSSLIPMVFSCLCCCQFIEITFFVFTNRINLLNLK